MNHKINYDYLFRKKDDKVVQYSKSALFEATRITYSDSWQYQQIRQNAVAYLKYFHSKGTIQEHPIVEGSEVVFVGQTQHLKFREVRERLMPYGVACKVFVKKTTTHVVLGGGAKSDKGFLEHEVTIISPKELNVALEELEQPYLLDKTADSEQNLSHLSGLLLSGQDENIALALEIFRGGGFPKELLHELLIAYKMTSTSKIRDHARALLYLHVSESSKLALKRLHNLSGRIGERNLANGIRRMDADAPEFSGAKIAHLMYARHRKGLTYLLDYLPNQERMDWLQGQMQEGCLNFSKSHLNKCPKIVGELSDLQSLDLSGNSLRTLPATIFSKLPQLKVLNVSHNNFRELPKYLWEMTELKELNMVFKSWIWQHTPKLKEEIADLQKALPNCRIVTNE